VNVAFDGAVGVPLVVRDRIAVDCDGDWRVDKCGIEGHDGVTDAEPSTTHQTPATTPLAAIIKRLLVVSYIIFP